MRFFANGPSIPDELLVARDEGRVVCFCGAGVSRARANLSDFFGLARVVIESLGVTDDSPSWKLINEARELESRSGISGLISADRVFGLLEREFSVRDIERAVARALKPSEGVDLSAHRTMLDLATAPDGKIRLVTTNFDLLFEACESSIQCWSPPRLPDPLRYEEFEGIIHLHGHVSEDYSGAAGERFVLASSEFGRAYLSEGWATQFIRTILDRYYVVFVGYTAEDPPVQYLLEALNKRAGSLEGVYAFQAGPADEAEANWRHKGVLPIVYEKTDEHDEYGALWSTLAAWAARARNHDAWYGNLIIKARRGPEALLPHERGQIAHIVSTLGGLRKFSASDEPLPADWLCVFDPAIRYSKPGNIDHYGEQETYFDPFDAYGLDSDPPPPKIGPDEYYANREIPEGVWNCFAATRLDRQNLQDANFAALRGHWAVNVPLLPERIQQLGVWISRVANQPAAVWWASQQAGIHPDLQKRIRFELERLKKQCLPQVRQAWRYIFEAWATGNNDFHSDWYRLKASIELDGWTNAAAREFARINRPYLKVQAPSWGRLKPPGSKDDVPLADMVQLDVEYPNPHIDIQIPDAFLESVVRELRKNLEFAVTLEREISDYGLTQLCPIEPDPGLDGESSVRQYGISHTFLFYVDIFKKLIDLNPRAAKQEYLAWRPDDDAVFTRLRIWAAGDHRILSGVEAGQVICALADESFWDRCHQRDLLLTLSKRWDDFPGALRRRIERRLLRGRARLKGENKNEYIEHRSWLSLDRIHWLDMNGCRFSFNMNAESEKLRDLAPEWQPQYAEHAAEYLEGRVYSVSTDTAYSALLTESLDTVLSRAKELSGRKAASFIESDPFAGLALERPVRAFSALNKAAKRNDYPAWAWRTFLRSEARKSDKPLFSALIAERVSRLPANVIAEFIHPISNWLLGTSKTLLSDYPEQFERVWVRLIPVLSSKPEIARSSAVQGSKKPDWGAETISAPVGKLAQALMNDPQNDGLEAGKGYPPLWIGRVEELLALEGDLCRHALVIFAFNLNWFFAIDPVWTEENLISVLDNEGDDQNAVWAGFFWRAKVPDPKLYMRLKPYLLRLAKRESTFRRHHATILSGILLAGWGSIDQETGTRCVTSAELRKVLINADEEIRSQMLWQLERWSFDEEARWGAKVPVFLKEVWPLHKKVRSPGITARLCQLALSNAALFPQIVGSILPLVTAVDQECLLGFDLDSSKDDIVTRYPETTLTLLYAVLPENASAWPYGTEKILEKIGLADPKLLSDSRLIELKRRWNAR